MIRALGFLIGLAAVAAPAVGWLLMTGRIDPAPVALPEPTAEAAPAPQPVPAAAVAPEDVSAETSLPGQAVSAAPFASIEPGPARAEPDSAEPTAAGITVTVPVEAEPDPAEPTAAGIMVTVPVWKPFRSERAARGFSAHVAEHYGVASEVHRQNPGVYQVVVSAETEEALQAQLDRLRAAAGLAELDTRP